ncbi:hypothetical protein Rxycam_01564 [Rubrobacter xylanophilus DSM 9941]|uniref:sulfotransferase family protein n=1 Tax=Rubrobacter xylanophilus TaxID=49319 RepID=UPI001C63E2AE|nr:sulfotransferase [Rubrobacter xylanophilus]QYJ15736.1 hypothetical protein Rxycam_01564 [Rubrobacter xylanophilus DSM 9941]
MDDLKVLYIVGLGRSGSTILANSLGQVEGFFSAGELNFIWKHNVLENRLCGCGTPFRECPVWRGVFRRAFGGMDAVDARRMISLQASGARTRHVLPMLLPAGRRRIAARLREYLANTGRLYRAMAEVTGSRVIIDSSKEPAYGYAVGMVPGVDLRVVHLVRDPRAAAYSWLKKKEQPDSETRRYMFRMGPARSAALWDAWNLSAEALWRNGRYLRLRYEDFVAEPGPSLRSILDFAGEPESELPLVGEREVKLGISHTVSGNPNRFETGAVELRPDERWRGGMSPRDRVVATVLTLPLLPRYGYSLTG